MKTRTVRDLIDERDAVERMAQELGIALPEVFLPEDDTDWNPMEDDDISDVESLVNHDPDL